VLAFGEVRERDGTVQCRAVESPGTYFGRNRESETLGAAKLGEAGNYPRSTGGDLLAGN
jgi:hypothetical protein